MIVGITGTLAAGKGTIVDLMIKKGFKHYSVRQFLIEEIEKRGLPVNRDSMVSVENQLRELNHPGFVVEKIYERAKASGGNCIIESIRTPGEISTLKEKGDFFLIAIDADIEKRYERAFARKSETDRISFEKFVDDEKREMLSDNPNNQNLSKCISLADFVIYNNGTIEQLEREIEDVFNKINRSQKRKDYLSWDEYFMGIALLSAQRSKDPSTQVGACIVNQENKIMGAGYNGFPIGCSDEELPWSREGNFLDVKYPYVCHAELNAILNSTKN